MRSPSPLSCLLLVAAVAAGCSEPNGPTISAESPPVPSFNFSDGPDDPGPIVIRTETVFAIFYADAKTGLSAVHGGDPVEFCGGIIDFDTADLQRITTPEDEMRFVDLLKGEDLTTSVWPFIDFDCSLFTTRQPMATGTADLVLTDNDFAAPLRENTNWNAFGWRAHGALESARGGTVSFSGHRNCRWDGDDVATLECRTKVSLN